MRPATVRSLTRRAVALVVQLEEIERLRAQRRQAVRLEVAVLWVELEAAEARTPIVNRRPLVERQPERARA